MPRTKSVKHRFHRCRPLQRQPPGEGDDLQKVQNDLFNRVARFLFARFTGDLHVHHDRAAHTHGEEPQAQHRLVGLLRGARFAPSTAAEPFVPDRGHAQPFPEASAAQTAPDWLAMFGRAGVAVAVGFVACFRPIHYGAVDRNATQVAVFGVDGAVAGMGVQTFFKGARGGGVGLFLVLRDQTRGRRGCFIVEAPPPMQSRDVVPANGSLARGAEWARVAGVVVGVGVWRGKWSRLVRWCSGQEEER